MFKFLCFPSVMILVPPFPPPPRFIRVPCPPRHLACLLSLFVLNASSLSVSVYSADHLQQWLGIPRPSVGRFVYNPPAGCRPKCPSPGVLSSVPYAGLHTPPTCLAGGTWLGCGWRGERDGSPSAMVWSPSTRRQASPGIACLRRCSSSLLNSLCARLSVCLPPPPPFPVQSDVYLYPPS